MASIRHCTIRRLTALSLALLLSLTALPLPAEASNVQDSLTVGITLTKTPVMRPLDPQERDIVSVYGLIYESLITIDDDYMPQAGIAESWEASADCRTWTFQLRRDGIVKKPGFRRGIEDDADGVGFCFRHTVIIRRGNEPFRAVISH